MTPIIVTDAATNCADWRLQIEPLNEHEEAAIAAEIHHYPQPQAATIEALKIVQQQQFPSVIASVAGLWAIKVWPKH